MIELNIIKLYENSNKLNEAKADIDNFIDKFGEETYDLFKRSTQRLKNKGISTDLTYHVKHTTKKDLDAILTNLQNRAITKDNDLTELAGDYEYLGTGKGYKVYKINDVVASINLGAGTGWCTSGRYGHYGEENYTPSRVEATKHWNDYTSQGAQFYFFISNRDKVALVVYPKTISYNVFVGNAYVKKTNCEVYDERDELRYDLLSSLPLNLIKSEIIFEGDPAENGLYIKNNVVVTCDKSLKEAVIPDGVTSIGEGAFSGSRLKNITIPDSVTSIGEKAFHTCMSLTSIKIPNSVTSIGKEAFYICMALTSIEIPNSTTSIGISAFEFCLALTSIKIPDSVTSIGARAFADCRKLTNITISDGVTSIGDAAFHTCVSLTSIKIPDSVTSIGKGAFADCSSLTSVTLGKNVRSIGENAFNSCGSLANITIPDSVTSIGKSAFGNCKNLTNVMIGNSVSSIGEHAFNWCENLKSITIPDSVTRIGGRAFRYCKSLTSVTIGKNVNSIGEGAFWDCPNLTNIEVSVDNPKYKSIDGKLYTKHGKLVF